MNQIKDAAIYILGAYAIYTLGAGQWVLALGGILAASAVVRLALSTYREA